MGITETITVADRALDDRDWQQAPLQALVDHIVTDFHDQLRAELPRLEALAAKVTRVHSTRDAFVDRIADAVGDLAADLINQMRKEELVLFPTLRSLEHADRHNASWIAAPLAVIEREHDRAGELLAELRRLTNNYTAPVWACATMTALYDSLEALEAETLVHLYLENQVLFPRARALAESDAPVAD